MSNDGWTPVYVEENLAVMSIAFMLDSPDEAVIWRGIYIVYFDDVSLESYWFGLILGPKKNGLIKQFLKDVNWSEVIYI